MQARKSRHELGMSRESDNTFRITLLVIFETHRNVLLNFDLWLFPGLSQDFLYGKDTKRITYSEFVNKELGAFLQLG